MIAAKVFLAFLFFGAFNGFKDSAISGMEVSSRKTSVHPEFLDVDKPCVGKNLGDQCTCSIKSNYYGKPKCKCRILSALMSNQPGDYARQGGLICLPDANSDFKIENMDDYYKCLPLNANLDSEWLW